eukprot:CAMPEP_0177683220 /NCGR_PEP_ID=MMETSP0447-20121125/31671_1 /TAXON_ID=0 /ORGANISM="Stygamoeba regulata, Strain BSH-02190019" /LENGTH=240 /DNA_ID=CAMNT_0019192765 /DNA_START=124 /DNA_END=843 /DNA_ORIENTATION=-
MADGSLLASASFDSTVSVWTKKDNDFDCTATLEGHENEVKGVAWAATRPLLATCSRDKSVWIWTLESNQEFECLSVMHGHTQDVKSVTWHPTEEVLFSCSYDNSVKVWVEDADEEEWSCAQTLMQHNSTVWEVAVSKDGLLASASDDKTVIIWQPTDRRKWACACVLTGLHSRAVYSVSWQPRAGPHRLATGCGDNHVRLFVEVPAEGEVNTALSFELEQTCAGHTADVNCVAWHPSGSA